TPILDNLRTQPDNSLTEQRAPINRKSPLSGRDIQTQDGEIKPAGGLLRKKVQEKSSRVAVDSNTDSMIQQISTIRSTSQTCTSASPELRAELICV
ncbi:hypothetical protein GQ607_003198, partial [Colletotrichum asianum]